jgi:hypothetical protein
MLTMAIVSKSMLMVTSRFIAEMNMDGSNTTLRIIEV